MVCYCYCYWVIDLLRGLSRARGSASGHQSAITHTDICSRTNAKAGSKSWEECQWHGTMVFRMGRGIQIRYRCLLTSVRYVANVAFISARSCWGPCENVTLFFFSHMKTEEGIGGISITQPQKEALPGRYWVHQWCMLSCPCARWDSTE